MSSFLWRMLIPSGKIFTTIRKNAKKSNVHISQWHPRPFTKYIIISLKEKLVLLQKYHSDCLIVLHQISSSIDLAPSRDTWDQLGFTGRTDVVASVSLPSHQWCSGGTERMTPPFAPIRERIRHLAHKQRLLGPTLGSF